MLYQVWLHLYSVLLAWQVTQLQDGDVAECILEYGVCDLDDSERTIHNCLE